MTTKPRVLLVGEAPSRLSDPSEPLGGRPSRWMAHHLGLNYESLRRTFDMRNLLDRYPGNSFPSALGAAAARAWVADARLRPYAVVVLLGRSVASAFRLDRAAFLERRRLVVCPGGCCSAAAVVLPHPSGLNRWWNVPESKALGLAELRRLAVESRGAEGRP